MKLIALLLVSVPLFGAEQKLFPNITFNYDLGSGNVIYIETHDGNILVDTGTTDVSRDLLKKYPNTEYVVATHIHGDHVGGIQAYADKGATIIAQPNTLKHFTTRSKPRINVKSTIPVSNATEMMVGHEKVRFIHYPNAHTDGDIIVYFPEKNFMHLGDISFGKMYNFIDKNYAGSIDGLISATEKIIAMTDNNTIITPGHGNVMTRRDLQNNLAMYKDIRNKVKAMKDRGMSLQEVLDAKPSIEYDGRYNWSFINGTKFVTSVYETLK